MVFLVQMATMSTTMFFQIMNPWNVGHDVTRSQLAHVLTSLCKAKFLRICASAAHQDPWGHFFSNHPRRLFHERPSLSRWIVLWSQWVNLWGCIPHLNALTCPDTGVVKGFIITHGGPLLATIRHGNDWKAEIFTAQVETCANLPTVWKRSSEHQSNRCSLYQLRLWGYRWAGETYERRQRRRQGGKLEGLPRSLTLGDIYGYLGAIWVPFNQKGPLTFYGGTDGTDGTEQPWDGNGKPTDLLRSVPKVYQAFTSNLTRKVRNDTHHIIHRSKSCQQQTYTSPFALC